MSLASLDRNTEGKPFLLTVAHTAMHDPFTCEAGYADRWQDEEIPEPPTLYDDLSARTKALAPVKQRVGMAHTVYEAETAHITDPLLRKKAQYQEFAKAYLRCQLSLDDSVGEILDYLDRSGISDNTLVIYTSDHGFFLGEHGLYDKRLMYEEAIRIPMLLRLPGDIEAGCVEDHMVLNVDLTPTLLDYAGIEIPASMQGRSIRPLLQGEAVSEWRTSLYYRYYLSHFETPPHWGVRTATHKLICFHDSDEWELYDLVQDPNEMCNLYDVPGHETLIAELKLEIERLREEAGDSEDGPAGNAHASRVIYT